MVVCVHGVFGLKWIRIRTGYQVTADGREVEGRDSIHEAFQRAVLRTARCRVRTGRREERVDAYFQAPGEFFDG